MDTKQNIIHVKNAPGDPNTIASIIVQNKIDFKPKISVIIPVHNAKLYLCECMNSVVNQTLHEIEVICVDDGSTDGSLEILKEYAQADRRITVLSQKNLHAGVARNAGLNVARGKYVHFLDADDWIALDTYEKLFQEMSLHKVVVLKFKSFTYDNIKQEISASNYTQMSSIPKKYFNRIISLMYNYKLFPMIMDSPWSGLYNREFLIKHNIYFDNLLCSNDVSFFYRCIVNARKIFLCNQSFVYYRVNNNKSLIGIRAYHIDDMIKMNKNIMENIINKENKAIQQCFRQHLYNNLMHHYNLALSQDLPYSVKEKLKNQIESIEQRKRAVIIESNTCHGECIPGFLKYLLDLKYDVDIILNEDTKTENPLSFSKLKYNIKFMKFDDIMDFIKNAEFNNKYDVVLINSDIVYRLSLYKPTMVNIINKLSRITPKILIVEHHLESITSAHLKNANIIVLKKFDKFKHVYQVNPHYFGEYDLHNKNKKTEFIIIGNIENKRKNFGLLLEAVKNCIKAGKTNFHVTIIGKGDLPLEDKDINLSKYITTTGRLPYDKMYDKISKSDFILPLLDPVNSEHKRYITTATSGTFQLVYGFNIPCVIEKTFADVHGFSNTNSIIYSDNNNFYKALSEAIDTNNSKYIFLKQNLNILANRIYNTSLYELNNAINEKYKTSLYSLKKHMCSFFKNIFSINRKSPYSHCLRFLGFKIMITNHTKRDLMQILTAQNEKITLIEKDICRLQNLDKQKTGD